MMAVIFFLWMQISSNHNVIALTFWGLLEEQKREKECSDV